MPSQLPDEIELGLFGDGWRYDCVAHNTEPVAVTLPDELGGGDWTPRQLRQLAAALCVVADGADDAHRRWTRNYLQTKRRSLG